jgi:preprotein translocase subunit YajC
MSNTAIFILIAIVVIGGIFWLVIYSSRRGEKHRQKTSIKPSEASGEEHSG